VAPTTSPGPGHRFPGLSSTGPWGTRRRGRGRLPRAAFGYDGPMSDSTPENQSGGSGGSDDQLISDDQLPEDLQPAKNPMARDPDDDSFDDDSDDDSQGGPSVEGMPDAGQPG
jgi:hypothetical protein